MAAANGDVFTAIEVNRRENWSVGLGAVLGALLGVLLAALFFAKPVQATAPEMPTHLSLAGSEWIVEQVQYPGDTANVLGYTRCDIRHIQIVKDIVGTEAARETLVHEILHAYVCGAGMDNFDVNNMYYNSESETKHDGIDVVAYVVSDAMHRNPQLAAYLAKGQ